MHNYTDAESLTRLCNNSKLVPAAAETSLSLPLQPPQLWYLQK